jgi:hypothetical protein
MSNKFVILTIHHRHKTSEFKYDTSWQDNRVSETETAGYTKFARRTGCERHGRRN